MKRLLATLVSGALLSAGCLSDPRPAKEAYDYQVITRWGGPGTQPGQLQEPQGLWVDADGEVFVSDAANCRIQVFDGQGQYLRSWGSCGAEEGLGKPLDVAVDPSGQVLVADFLRDQILLFSQEGRPLGAWCQPGEDAGQLSGPVGLALDSQGAVLVSEFYNHRLQALTAAGEWSRFIGTELPESAAGGHHDEHEENGQDPHAGEEHGPGLHYPTKPAVDSGGHIWVIDHQRRLLEFDPEGQLVRAFRPGQEWDRFDDVTDIAIDSQGRFHMSDSGQGKVKLYSSQGRLITEWAVPEVEGAHYRSPVALALDHEDNLYVSDIASHSIFKLRLVPRAGGDGQD